MPVQVSYPGVYVEEVPSSVRTIAGVSTSIAAFLGWASQGPAGRAERCLSFSDYERTFGPLDPRSHLGYAVSHFFGNGGAQCYVLRLTSEADVAATATIAGFTVEAVGPGKWSENYGIRAYPRPDQPERFRLDVIAVKDVPGGPAKDSVLESHANLSLDAFDSRFVTSVLAEDSGFVAVKAIGDATKPPKVTAPATFVDAPLTGGADGAPLKPEDDGFDAGVLDAAEEDGVLDKIDQINLLNVPGFTRDASVAKLQQFCRRRRALLLVDSALGSTTTSAVMAEAPKSELTGDDGINAAFYYPWLLAPDSQAQGRIRPFPPCGAIAGVFARTDATRGVWKAPAGTDASLSGVVGVTLTTTDKQNGVLNPLAVNVIRKFPVYGTVVWGARTLRGNDAVGSEWKYVPVRRTALFIEESLFRGLKWVVFEPNDEPLWASIRLNVGSFMNDLFRQGAFQGTTPKDAYFVKCDKDTTTQSDINRGIVNILVGFAPLKPAEFVVIKLQQLAGQLAT